MVYNFYMDKKTVYIIDDDRNIVRALKEILEKEGFVVFSSENGEEGIARIKEIKPELILLDLVLPDQSGFKIAQEIKSIPQCRDIPIIAISLKKEDVDKHIAAMSGIADYLEKPLDYQRLLFVMKNILGGNP
jgi:two-component system phosphate regulon response regulator PhoB